MNNIYVDVGQILDITLSRGYVESQVYAVIDSLIAAGCELPMINGFPQFTGEEAQLILDQLAVSYDALEYD